MNLPEFLVVGAAKAGTTSIYYYLRQNPDIFLSELKESNYLVGFDPYKEQAKIYRRKVITSELDYFSLFETAGNDQLCGEVCPLYLYYYDRTIPRIKQYLGGKTKIIIILRNPIDRCYSGYGMYVSQGMEELTFAATLLESNHSDLEDPNHWRRYYNLTCGLYFNQVRSYLKEFGQDQVRVFRYENLAGDADRVMCEITDFLGLPAFDYDTSEVKNVTWRKKEDFVRRVVDKRARRLRKLLMPYVTASLKERYRNFMNTNQKVPLDKQVRSFLQSYYRNDVENLQDLLGWDLSLWLKDNA